MVKAMQGTVDAENNQFAVKPNTTPLGININAWNKNVTPFFGSKKDPNSGVAPTVFVFGLGSKTTPEL
jgi:hypothetical protein